MRLIYKTNALTTDYEICRNYPSPVLYFSLLLHATHPHARPRWAALYAGGGLKFPTLFRCAASFTWATCIPSSGSANCVISVSIPRSVIWEVIELLWTLKTTSGASMPDAATPIKPALFRATHFLPRKWSR